MQDIRIWLLIESVPIFEIVISDLKVTKNFVLTREQFDKPPTLKKRQRPLGLRTKDTNCVPKLYRIILQNDLINDHALKNAKSKVHTSLQLTI